MAPELAPVSFIWCGLEACSGNIYYSKSVDET